MLLCVRPPVRRLLLNPPDIIPQHGIEATLACRLIEYADYVFIAVFTLEYVIRLLVSGDLTDMYTFMISVPNLVDLVAILPFYVELLIAATIGSSVRAL